MRKIASSSLHPKGKQIHIPKQILLQYLVNRFQSQGYGHINMPSTQKLTVEQKPNIAKLGYGKSYCICDRQ